MFASECRKFCRPSKECVQGKGRKKECVRKERDNGRNVFGKGHRKGCVPFLMRVGTCKGTEGKVFANMSAGADRKANPRQQVRARAAYLSEVTALPLSTSHSLVMPFAV